VELIIFDCDGVLVDSERIAIRTNIEALAQYGYAATEAQIVEAFVGKSTPSILAVASEWIGADRAPMWMDEFRALYYQTLENEVETVDGIVEALDQITLPTAVASSGTHEKMKMTLGRTGLYERFAGRIFSASEVERGKPAPDLFLHTARQLQADPAHCAVVEDSAPGVQAAIAAGMRCFAYTGGVTPASALDGYGATLFSDMRQLPGLLRGN
jgi:HAD superfamily hydrolase (TIGR01509 family)